MKILEKIAQKQENNRDCPTPCIAFLGNSVTQGCFELLRKSEEETATVFDVYQAYPYRLAMLLNTLYPTVPVNILNAGVNGDDVDHALQRLERDVLRMHPDLAVVSFGLNETSWGMDGLDRFCSALDRILDVLQKENIEIIYMTTNTQCLYVSGDLTDDLFRRAAQQRVDLQCSGVTDAYMKAASDLCRKRGIRVCDCYRKWKALAQNGVDTTQLLSNRINHPTRSLHQLFAVSLLETMLDLDIFNSREDSI